MKMFRLTVMIVLELYGGCLVPFKKDNSLIVKDCIL